MVQAFAPACCRRDGRTTNAEVVFPVILSRSFCNRSTRRSNSNRLSWCYAIVPALPSEGFFGPFLLLRSDIMARKIVNRKELRAEAEAAERADAGKKPVKKKAAKRKSRAKKVAAAVRMKLF